MGLYEELAQNFPEEQTVFGVCLLIPHSAYKSEWNEQLKAEGVKVFQQSYNGRLFFFLKKANSNNETVDSKPAPAPSEQAKPIRRFTWTTEDLEKLRQLREQGLSLNEMAKQLGKTKGSVLGKLRALKKLNESTPKPKLEADCISPNDSLFKEYIEAFRVLYPRFKKACALLLREASNLLESE